MCNFNICQCYYQERRLGQADKTISGRQTQHIRPEWNTIKSQIPERNINLNFPITLLLAPLTKTYRIRDFLRKFFEFPVQCRSSSPFLSFLFMFIIISISVFPFPITRLVDLSIRYFSEELHVFSFLLAHHDWIL
jgi:hypothetical protein